MVGEGKRSFDLFREVGCGGRIWLEWEARSPRVEVNYISVSHWNEATVPSALDPLSASSSGSRPSPGCSCLPGLFLIVGVRDGVKPLVRQR